KDLREHPESLDIDMGFLVMTAIQSAFLCPAAPKQPPLLEPSQMPTAPPQPKRGRVSATEPCLGAFEPGRRWQDASACSAPLEQWDCVSQTRQGPYTPNTWAKVRPSWSTCEYRPCRTRLAPPCKRQRPMPLCQVRQPAGWRQRVPRRARALQYLSGEV